MAGNPQGGKKAAKTNMENYGPDFYKRIGALGGKVSHGGFETLTVGKDGLTGPERAQKVGVLGGLISRRTKEVKNEDIKDS